MNIHDRRSAQRTTLSRLVEVAVSDGRDAQAVCRIIDISPFGLRLEFVSAEDAKRFSHCRVLNVIGCGEAIQALLLHKSCEVRWRQGAILGARFQAPLGVPLEGPGMDMEFTSF